MRGKPTVPLDYAATSIHSIDSPGLHPRRFDLAPVTASTRTAATIATDTPAGGGQVALALSSLGSAVITAGLLFIDGSFVMAATSVAKESGLEWIGRDDVSQTLIFMLAPLLVVVQWMMIDYLRRRLRWQRRDGRSDEAMS